MFADHWQKLATGPLTPALTQEGLVALPRIRALRFTGPDVIGFLQGYLTSSTEALTPQRFQPAALCNLQGRVIANGWCIRSEEDQVIWLIHASVVEIVTDFMKPYLAFSKTRLSVVDDCLVLGRIGGVESSGPALAISENLSLILASDIGELERLIARYGVAEPKIWHRTLIEKRIVWVSEPVSARFLPQMLNLVELGAIDFDKGCYLGQEVVARAQHRGRVKRNLMCLRIENGPLPTPGEMISAGNDREVGTVMQTDEASLCLAVIRESATPPYRCGDSVLSDFP